MGLETVPVRHRRLFFFFFFPTVINASEDTQSTPHSPDEQV